VSGHTPSIDGAGCSAACDVCAREAAVRARNDARELDALRDLRALVLRSDTMRREYPVDGAVPGSASVVAWSHIVQAAERAKR